VVLVESSVWIAQLRGAVKVTDRIKANDVAICPPVVMEVQQGLRNEKTQRSWQVALATAQMLEDPMPLATFELAADLFRVCQDRGVASASIDCLIAACAIRNDVPLFTLDTDFDRIAAVSPLRLLSRP
jgi:predicted nucleic acid-binding protein